MWKKSIFPIQKSVIAQRDGDDGKANQLMSEWMKIEYEIDIL